MHEAPLKTAFVSKTPQTANMDICERTGSDAGDATLRLSDVGKMASRFEHSSNLLSDRGAAISERKNGAPGKIRTPNLLIRSQVLYPVELRAPDGDPIAKAAKPTQ